MRDQGVVPALMFHSVGLQDHPWVWSSISEPISTFEEKIALLKRSGFTGVFWNELYDYMAGRCSLPKNSILLTFDDGYLDNWVYIYPILKKYQMKGTIFVNPDFVDSLDATRPNLEDITSRRCSEERISIAGFLSWAEMRQMESSGLIDIQSHAMTHTWYFSGPTIVDFHRPHAVTPYPWLFWNVRPDRKPYYLNEDQQEFLPWGYPILEHQKSLITRCYFPDDGAVEVVIDFVLSHGGREFFRQHGWQGILEKEIVGKFGDKRLPGSYESDESRAARIRDELQQSKSLIEKNLDKHVDFICWPGGANDETVQTIARQVGYKAWTLDSRSRRKKRNTFGTEAGNIKRIGTTNRISVRGVPRGVGGPRYFLWRILEHQGSKMYSVGVRACKVAALARSILKPA